MREDGLNKRDASVAAEPLSCVGCRLERHGLVAADVRGSGIAARIPPLINGSFLATRASRVAMADVLFPELALEEVEGKPSVVLTIKAAAANALTLDPCGKRAAREVGMAQQPMSSVITL